MFFQISHRYIMAVCYSEYRLFLLCVISTVFYIAKDKKINAIHSGTFLKQNKHLSDDIVNSRWW